MSEFSTLVGKKEKQQNKQTFLTMCRDYLLQPGFALTLVCFIASTFIVYLTMKSEAIGPALGFLMVSFTVFAAALTHEILTRRSWEEDLSLRYLRMIKKIGHLEEQIVLLDDDNKKLKLSVVSLIDQVQEKKPVRDQAHYQDMLHDLNLHATKTTSGVQEQPVPAADTMTKMMHANQSYKQTQTIQKDVSVEASSLSSPVDATPSFIEPVGRVKQTLKKAVASSQEMKEGFENIYALPEFETEDKDGIEFEVNDEMQDIVSTAVRDDRVDIFLQPIVKLPNRKISFYEVFARLKKDNGDFIPATDYMMHAAKGYMPAIDNLLLLRCVQHMRLDKKVNGHIANAYFINLNIETLLNATFMSDLVDFLSDNEHLAQRLVLEMKQADFNEVEDQIWPLMMGLAKLGCRFSLDEVTDFDMDAQHLKQRSIRFVKVDADVIIDRVSSQVGERAFTEMKKDLEFYDVELIVHKIEDDEQLLSLLDVNIDFGQGYLFAHPAHSKDLIAA